MDSIRGRSERIVNHFTRAASFDQAGASQVGEVSGDFWLGYSQNVLKLANAVLPLGEQVQQPQAG